eukprot:4629340-Prymnesium_polylepis.1
MVVGGVCGGHRCAWSVVRGREGVMRIRVPQHDAHTLTSCMRLATFAQEETGALMRDVKLFAKAALSRQLANDAATLNALSAALPAAVGELREELVELEVKLTAMVGDAQGEADAFTAAANIASMNPPLLRSRGSGNSGRWSSRDVLSPLLRCSAAPARARRTVRPAALALQSVMRAQTSGRRNEFLPPDQSVETQSAPSPAELPSPANGKGKQRDAPPAKPSQEPAAPRRPSVVRFNVPPVDAPPVEVPTLTTALTEEIVRSSLESACSEDSLCGVRTRSSGAPASAGRAGSTPAAAGSGGADGTGWNNPLAA